MQTANVTAITCDSFLRFIVFSSCCLFSVNAIYCIRNRINPQARWGDIKLFSSLEKERTSSKKSSLSLMNPSVLLFSEFHHSRFLFHFLILFYYLFLFFSTTTIAAIERITPAAAGMIGVTSPVLVAFPLVPFTVFPPFCLPAVVA